MTIRKAFSGAVFLAALCTGNAIGCSSDTAPSKAGDGAAGAAGSDSGVTSTGGSSGDSGAGGASGGPADGSKGGGTCGNVFGRSAACNSCLESHCCDLGTACGTVPDCVALVQCVRDCDAKPGSKPNDQCHTDCSTHLTAASRPDYNGLVQCMGQFCLSECPFSGP